MLEIITTLLAGLGLYFTGVGGIRSNLQQLPGRNFRTFLRRATASPVLSAWSGFLMGTVTQTSIGTAVILAGLISRGLATLRQALPIVAWSNLGLVTLVFLNTLPVHILAMTLIGLAGICVNFGLGGRIKWIMPPLYSLGLLLFGLRLLKVGLSDLSRDPTFAAFIAQMPTSGLVAFALGAALRVPIQSTSAVALIGMTLCTSGIFSQNQALLMLIGTALGTGISAYYLTAHFRGEMRQIALFESIINLLAGIVMLGFYYTAKFSGHEISPAGASEDLVLAMVFLVQQGLCVGFAYALAPWMPGILKRLAPPTVEEDLSRPRYIYDGAVQDVPTGLSLAEQELRDLLARMPLYLAGFRAEASAPLPPPVGTLHTASLSVIHEVQVFLAALADRRVRSHQISVALLQAQRRLDLILAIEEAVNGVSRELARLQPSSSVSPLVHNLVESLDLALQLAISASNGEKDDLEMLGRLTAAPGTAIQDLRKKYLGEDTPLDYDERAVAVALIGYHERTMWTLHHLCGTLHRPIPST
ncbi:MAG TPA: Na/Pi symporter [Chthoniobacterales bacterium]